MINKVILIGNLGKAPELKHFDNGKCVARLSLATNEAYKDKNGDWQNITDWHVVNVWGRATENIETRFVKGEQVYVEGKIKTRMYEDATGVKRYVTEIHAYVLKKIGGNKSPQTDKTIAKSVNIPQAITEGDEPDDLPF